jgi:hypothetical protein
VPRISAFYGIVISMNWREHLPPHFHAVYGEFEAGVAIADGHILEGDLPPRAGRLVREWARLRHDGLMANWHRAEARLPLHQIAPLP